MSLDTTLHNISGIADPAIGGALGFAIGGPGGAAIGAGIGAGVNTLGNALSSPGRTHFLDEDELPGDATKD